MDTMNPSTGGLLIADTSFVRVSIDYIKIANAKMIERDYLININKQQDSIIVMKDKYIKEQYNVIKDFQKKFIDSVEFNDRLVKQLEKQSRKLKVIGYSAAGITIGFIISLIL